MTAAAWKSLAPTSCGSRSLTAWPATSIYPTSRGRTASSPHCTIPHSLHRRESTPRSGPSPGPTERTSRPKSYTSGPPHTPSGRRVAQPHASGTADRRPVVDLHVTQHRPQLRDRRPPQAVTRRGRRDNGQAQHLRGPRQPNDVVFEFGDADVPDAVNRPTWLLRLTA